jgi:hypothetical protein
MPWPGWWPTKPSDAFKQLGDNLHLGGAAGILGTRAVAQAKPAGSTLTHQLRFVVRAHCLRLCVCEGLCVIADENTDVTLYSAFW